MIVAKDVVLGLVIERPGYGYELARRLEERFGSSGFAPTGVYAALDQLRAEELVRSAGRRAGRRDGNERAAPRTIYEATAKGVDRFERWMLQSASLAPVRDELYIKIALSRPRDLPRLIELAEGQERDCLTRIAQLRNAGPERSRAGEPQWPDLAVLLVRDAEIRQLQARIEWLQRARAVMKGVCARAREAREIPEGEMAAESRVA